MQTITPNPDHSVATYVNGLSSTEATRRLLEFGSNVIIRKQSRHPWWQFIGQFSGLTIWLLIGAGAVSLAVGQSADGLAILMIVMLNAVVGFLQEYRAEKSILALRRLATPKAKVIRDGRLTTIAAAQMVPGDLMILEAGDLVAADARLVESSALLVNEAPLTGESMPAEKNILPEVLDAPLAERSNTIFLGTTIANGTGRAIVTHTGMSTQLGKVAGLLASIKIEPTPLQKKIAELGKILLFVCFAIVTITAALEVMQGVRLFDVWLSAVSLAVAAVPEGLPAMVTIALAIGVQRMAARHVLVRRLSAVETLGCTTVICTDKTGTLTTGVMVVREMWGAQPKEMLNVAVACCNAELDKFGTSGVGDPTELAILAAAAEHGISKTSIELDNPRLQEIPFDSVRKRMSIFRRDGTLYVKGALESLLPLCQSVVGHQDYQQAALGMASRGLRVLTIAKGAQRTETALHLIGLIGVADPPRSEAIEAVTLARQAGIRTVMITGDHPVTAQAIAREMGILPISGELADEVVYARVTPEDKLNIIRHWKLRGEVVAMTGDGVNDAPALREAHIGVAMGKGGTEVAREASAMVLLDDNFASIVAAIREGRGIYANIQKTLVYLLAGNCAELLVMLGAVLMGMPIPLLPLQLLWINLVTDGLPALALVMDPPESDLLQRPPRPVNAAILGRAQWQTIIFTGIIEAFVTLIVFAWKLNNSDIVEARRLAFSVIVFSEIFRSFAFRSEKLIFWQVGALSNLRLVAVVILSALFQIAIHFMPLTQQLFGLGPLVWNDLAFAITCGLIPVSLLEISKLIRNCTKT